jgi:D-alanyl-D-alanine carboxypeptidase
MKTGYTDKAKHCLVSSGEHGGREVICVILGSSKDRVFTDSARMLRWALGLPQEAPTAVTSRSRKKGKVKTPKGQAAQKTAKKHFYNVNRYTPSTSR